MGQEYRSIWISDVHLGTRACRAEFLLDFYRHHESEYLYLVGDIIDAWQFRKGWYWEQSHNDVIQKTLRKARKGTRVVYVPGNHDEMLREYVGHDLGGIELEREAIHVTADKRRLMVVHGDMVDAAITYARWLVKLGDHASEMVLTLNHVLNRLRRGLGMPYWSLSTFVKSNLAHASEYITAFEEAMAAEARRRYFDGVVCGHIHQPRIRDVGGVLYCNDGDWVENCTALVEHFDGRLEIVPWCAVTAPAVTEPRELEPRELDPRELDPVDA